MLRNTTPCAIECGRNVRPGQSGGARRSKAGRWGTMVFVCECVGGGVVPRQDACLLA